MCGNREDAEDVLAESLVKAYRSLSQLEDETSFRAWLAQIARRTCGRLKRKEAMQPLVALATLEGLGIEPAAQDDPSTELEEAELKACIQHAFAELPAHYQEVYRLRDIEGQDIEAVASNIGITVRNAKTRLHRARQRLRTLIDGSLES